MIARGYGGGPLFLAVTDGRSGGGTGSRAGAPPPPPRAGGTRGGAGSEPVPDEMARALLGGNGFAARLLLDHVPAGVDAYDEANAGVFAGGALPDTTAPRSR